MSEARTAGAVARLEAAAEDLASARAAVEEVGEGTVREVADAYDRFDDLLERYREPASGSGVETFKAFVEFGEELDDLVSRLPEDLRHREAFEAAEDVLDRRRLEERDFERARAELEPVREVVELLARREDALDDYRDARRAVEARRREVAAEIEELESVLAFDDVDFDAPVDALREPIRAYEDAVDEAFRAFRSDAPAREVLSVVAATDAYPLVDFPLPPAELRDYLADHPAGEESIPTVLEWAGFSSSKLEHYVEDPTAFRVRVAGNRSYLERLDAEPLHVGWPPPPAAELRFTARELVGLLERFAPATTVERLHAVREVARRSDYGRVRRTAVAREELSEADRRQLRDGSIHEELEELREERERLDDTLADHPPE